MYRLFLKKLHLLHLLPLLLLAVFLLFPDTAMAEFSLNPITWYKNQVANSFVDGVNVLLQLTLSAFGLLLALAGLILEQVINVTILKMRYFIEGDGSFQGLQSIDLAWRTIRDVANIVFVFVLLLISINIILGSWGNEKFDKKLIPKVIIAALLINFSLVFTKVVIDISNLTAYEFYKTAANLKTRGSAGEPIFGIPTTGLTTSIMNGLQIARVMNKEGVIEQNLIEQSTYSFFATILAVVVVLVAAFVLMTISGFLLVRFILFILLMITSPIAFLGELLPQLRPHSEKWWSTLTSQAVFAPIFFILILIVVLIINDAEFMKAVQPASTYATSGETSIFFSNLVGILIQFTIVIGLLMAALIAAKQTAGSVGSGFTAWGQRMAKTVAFGGIKTLGRGARNLAAVGAREGVSRVAEGVGKKYDRAISEIGPEKYARLNKYTLGGLGAFDRGLRGKIKGAEDVKFGLKQTRAEVKKSERGRQKDLYDTAQETERDQNRKANEAYVRGIFEDGKEGTLDSKNDERVKAYFEAFKDMTDKEIEEMLENNLELLKQEHVAGALTAKQMSLIRERKDLDKDTIKTIENAHSKGTVKRVELATDKVAEATKVLKGSPADIAKLSKDVLTHRDIAPTLTAGMLREILNTDKLDVSERQGLKDTIEARGYSLAGQATRSPEEEKEFAHIDKLLKWFDHPDNKHW